MQAFSRGDENAFRELFAKYKNKIINFCFRFCLDRGVAEELAQEVFLRVYQAKDRYRPEARFSTWLYRIAVNVCLNESRKSQYKVQIQSLDQPRTMGHSESYSDLADDHALTSQDMLEAGDQEEWIQKTMAALPDKQRMALLLRIMNEFSYRDIASQMGISETKVKSLIFKGRQRLQRLLKPYLSAGNTHEP